NTTHAPLAVKVAFGGQSGIGSTGANSSAIVKTSSGDALVTPDDSWAEVATPADGTTLVGGPQITVFGTLTFAGDWLNDTFNKPLSYTPDERNFQAYVNTLMLPPGRSRSVLHFVILGSRVTAATTDDVRVRLEATANRLAAAPEISDLTTAEIC